MHGFLGKRQYAAKAPSRITIKLSKSKRLLKLYEKCPEVEQVIQVCMRFRKMLHDVDVTPGMDEWLIEAGACQLKEIWGFAEYIRKDRKAVELACQTSFNNGLLERIFNKAQRISRIIRSLSLH